MLTDALPIDIHIFSFEGESDFKLFSKHLNLFYPLRFSLTLFAEARASLTASWISSKSANVLKWCRLFFFSSRALKILWKEVWVEFGEVFFCKGTFLIADKSFQYACG